MLENLAYFSYSNLTLSAILTGESNALDSIFGVVGLYAE